MWFNEEKMDLVIIVSVSPVCKETVLRLEKGSMTQPVDEAPVIVRQR